MVYRLECITDKEWVCEFQHKWKSYLAVMKEDGIKVYDRDKFIFGTTDLPFSTDSLIKVINNFREVY